MRTRTRSSVREWADLAAMFDAKGAGDIYATLVSAARTRIAPRELIVDPKLTCVHFNAPETGTAYAGVHPRKGAVLVTLVTRSRIASPRVRKAIDASANRCYCDVLIASRADIDNEFLGWLNEAAKLVASKATRKRDS